MHRDPRTLLVLTILSLGGFGCDQVIPGSDDPAADAPTTIVPAGDLPVGECAPTSTLACGSSVAGDTSDPNSGYTTVLDGYPVAPGNFDGPEIAWDFVADRTGEVTWRLDGAAADVERGLLVLSGDDACRADHAVAGGQDEVTFDVVEGERYYLLVDGLDGDAGPFSAEVVCDEEPVEPPSDEPPATNPLEAASVVRISTELSPSWVAWSEIEVWGVWAGERDSEPFNLALEVGVSIVVSGETAEGPATAAIDGSLETSWNAGDFAPAFIELHLPQAALISSIRMQVAQNPAGLTRHLLELALGDGPFSLVHAWESLTEGGGWLSWLNPLFGPGDSCDPLELNLIMEQTQQACPDCQIWFWGMGVPEQMPRLELDWTDSNGSHTSNYSAGPLGTDGTLMTTRILAEPPWWGPGACPADDPSCMLDFLHHFEARGTMDGAPLWHGMLRAELPNVPCDATITRARLHLHINEDEGLANSDHTSVVSFHRGTKPWSPDKVHGLRYDVDEATGQPLTWDTPGGDFGEWVLDLHAQTDFWDRGFHKGNPAAWFDFTDHLVQLQQER
jgi:hypothetical protein